MKFMLIKRLFYTSLVIGSVVFSASSTQASNATPSAAPVFNINLDSTAFNQQDFLKINLRTTLIKVISTNTDANTAKTLSHLLAIFSKNSLSYAAIAGFDFDFKLPVDMIGAHNINELASRSVFVNTKFQFTNPQNWLNLFYAEQRNNNLLATIYGPTAAAQIETTPNAASELVKNHVAFVHFYTNPVLTQQQTNDFWLAVAKASAQQKQPIAITIIDSDLGSTIDYMDTVTLALNVPNQNMLWLGEDDTRHFRPLDLLSDHASVWRMINQKIAAYSFSRDHLPESFYIAMGNTKLATNLIIIAAQRAQKAAQMGLNFLDAHLVDEAYQSQLAFANTLVLGKKSAFIPASLQFSSSRHVNIILLDPSANNVQKLFNNQASIVKIVNQQNFLGIFDYSQGSNPTFYKKLAGLLAQTPNAKVIFNASNKMATQNFLAACSKIQTLKITLGPDAKLLATSQLNHLQ